MDVRQKVQLYPSTCIKICPHCNVSFFCNWISYWSKCIRADRSYVDVQSDFSSVKLSNICKDLNTINILVIGYTISHLIPIGLNKAEKTKLEAEDFENWKDVKGFKDDEDGLFHKIFKWIPPKTPPEDLTKEEFEKNLQTKDGLNFLENYRTSKGVTIGSYEKMGRILLKNGKRQRGKNMKNISMIV